MLTQVTPRDRRQRAASTTDDGRPPGLQPRWVDSGERRTNRVHAACSEADGRALGWRSGLPSRPQGVRLVTTLEDISALTRPNHPDDWTEVDSRAVDTVRVLAADAVQKVGNGHPGTAMSLAPAGVHAVPAADAARPGRPALAGPRPLRAVLRALQPDPVHPALPRRLRPGAGRPRGAAHLGVARPRATRSSATPRASRSPPARSGQGLASAVGMAMAARCERGLFDPDAAPGERPFDHFIYVIASDGDMEEGVTARGVLARRHPAARQPDRVLRRQPDLDRGRHQHRVLRGRRRALRGLRLARADASTGPATASTSRTSRADAAIEAAKAVTDKPSFIALRTIIGWPGAEQAEHRQGARLGARRRRGRRDQEGPRLRPGQDLRGRRRGHRAHPQARRPRPGSRRPSGRRRSTPGRAANPERTALLDRLQARELPDGWDDDAADVASRTEGRGHPRRVRQGAQRARARCCPSCGAARPTSPSRNNTTIKGAPSFVPAAIADQGRGPATRTAACCTSASASTRMGAILNGIALHGAHPRVRRHVPEFSDYMRAAVRLAALMGSPSSTSGPTTRSASARTARPTSRSSTWPRCGPSPASRGAARPTPTRPPYAWRGHPASTPTGPVGLVPDPAERADVPRGVDGHQRRRRAPRAATCWPTPTGGRRRGHPDRHRLGGAAGRRGARDAAGRGHPTRVVSMPCRRVVRRAGRGLPRDRAPAAVKARVSVEAGVAQGWHESSATPAGSSRSSTTAPPPTTRRCSASSASPPRPSWPPRETHRTRRRADHAHEGRRPDGAHMTDQLAALSAAGVSIWLDDLSRERLQTGNLAGADRRPSTSSASPPTRRSSRRRSSNGDAYDDAGRRARRRAAPTSTTTVRDGHHRRRPRRLRRAAPSRTTPTDGVDGRVSIEVDPRLAHDTDATIAAGQRAVEDRRPAQPADQDPGHRWRACRRSPPSSPRASASTSR